MQRFNRTTPRRLRLLLRTGTVSLMTAVAIASCMVSFSAKVSSHTLSVKSDLTSQPNQEDADLSHEWRLATDAEEDAQWNYILNSPMGIAALNQLAIEGFISPLCPKTFYINDFYGGFQSLMVIQCPDPRGASSAVGYDEVHVIFNRFETNIEGFDIQRLGEF